MALLNPEIVKNCLNCGREFKQFRVSVPYRSTCGNCIKNSKWITKKNKSKLLNKTVQKKLYFC